MIRKQNLCPGSKNAFDLRQSHLIVFEQQNLFSQHAFSAGLNWDTELLVNTWRNELMARFTTCSVRVKSMEICG